MPTPTGPLDIEVVKSIAFPFRLGALSFPQMLEGDNSVVFNSMVALILTGKNERVMHNDVGTNVHRFVFDNLGPLARARVAADVARAFALYEPRAEILSIDAVDGQTVDEKLSETTIVVNIVWRLNGEVESQQIPIPTGM